MKKAKILGDIPTLGMAVKPSEPPIFKYKRQPARQAIPAKLRFEVMQRDNFRCRFCGASRTDDTSLEVDHIVPVSRGGTNDPHNLQTLCRSCNLGKSNQLL